MRNYMPGARAVFLPYAPGRVHRRRFAAGRTLDRALRRRFATRFRRNYQRFFTRLRTSSLQAVLTYRRLTPAQRRLVRLRYYRTGDSRLFHMQGRRPRLRHMRY